jgi:hypothetical protein
MLGGGERRGGDPVRCQATGDPGPAVGGGAAVVPGDVERRVLGVAPDELVAEQRGTGGAHGVEQAEGRGAPGIRVAPDHRHQGHDPGAAADQLHRPLGVRTVGRGAPDEPAAGGSPQLEPVADLGGVDEIGRDLAVVETVDRDLEAAGGRRRGDRVRAHGRVAVLGGEPDVDVLAGDVVRPALDLDRKGARSRRLRTGGDDGPGTPAHQYRCSFHGSPYMW